MYANILLKISIKKPLLQKYIYCNIMRDGKTIRETND